MLGKDPTAEGHICYGSQTVDALEHIISEGGPRELPQHKVFACNDIPPHSLLPKIKVDSLLILVTLEEALHQLHKQPIGAALVEFTEMWSRDKDAIYYGPLTPYSQFIGHHAVIIVSIQKYRGEVVAICKSSNGRHVGAKGYIRVSLSTMYMVLGAKGMKADAIRATPTPQHLLSCFFCPIYNDPELMLKRKRDWLPWNKFYQSRKSLCRGHRDRRDVQKKKKTRSG